MATLLPCELVGGGELSSKSWDKKQPLRSKKVRKIKRVAPVASSINTVTNSATIDEPVKSMGNKVTKKRFVAHVESVSFGLPPTTLQRGTHHYTTCFSTQIVYVAYDLVHYRQVFVYS